jgi:hypothetical protein
MQQLKTIENNLITSIFKVFDYKKPDTVYRVLFEIRLLFDIRINLC